MESWRVLAASEPGSGHLVRGTECQDAHAYQFLPDGTLIIAVADGAGTARHSAEGAQIAVRESLAFLSNWLSRAQHYQRSSEEMSIALKGAASAAREAIHSHCRRTLDLQPDLEIEAKDFATTLLLVILVDGTCGLLQVGDGAVVTQNSSDALEVLTTSGHEEYINETTFLTSADAVDVSHIRVEFDTDIRGVGVMTDGIQLLGINHLDNSAFEPFFGPLFRFARSSDTDSSDLSQFLRSDRVCDRTDDDKTLVIAVVS